MKSKEKKMKQTFAAGLAAAVTALSCTVTGIHAEQGAVTEYGGWFESAYAEWDANAIGGNVSVSYAENGSGAFQQADAELIRGTRVDIPGLKGNTQYTLHIEGSAGSADCTVQTMAYDRTGYAHDGFSDIGAYMDDGTLKPDVTVIYVTNENKDTITYNGKTGLYNIFFSAKPKKVLFRFVGTIDVPAGTVANDGSHNDGSNMLYLQNSSEVTVEGIGPDTNLIDWGIEMKRCTSCEFRNLWLGHYPDDGIAMTGNEQIRTEHIWIHNNTIEKGYNAFAGNGHVDADKADGDGSLDMKWAHHITVSYNQFINCHKTSLVGGRIDQEQDYITYHHNWFNNTESRNPRARNAHIHSFNNYFLSNSEYGICASYNSKVFSESNYFEGANNPLYAINMGKDAYSGTIKSYHDLFVNCDMGGTLAYQIVTERNAQPSIPNLIEGGEGYDQFDSSLYAYQTQTPEEAKETVLRYAGRMPENVPQGGDVIPEETTTTTSVTSETTTAATVTEPAAVRGDVNLDGSADLADAVALIQYLLKENDLTDAQAAKADLDESGRINAADLTLLKRMLLNN
ncbi:MAG: hypothetical protein IKS42_03385 [Oscillospiraceae bacterium]|nr:hypothetical protein [Oscillospiraceae bacterium]